jgi:tetratricopeptide (TPR) repeat protein
MEAESAGRIAEAEQLCAKVLSMDRLNTQALLMSGRLAARTGRVSLAIDRLRFTITIDPNCVSALTWLSMLLRESNKLTEAAKFAERAVRLAPRNSDAIYNLGLCCFLQGEYERSIDCFERATELSPDVSAYHYALGLSYEAIGGDWPALMAFRNSVAINPDRFGLLKLGQLSLAVGRSSEAIDCAKKILEQDPENAEAHLLFASGLLDANRSEESEAHLQSAISSDPKLAGSFKLAHSRRLRQVGRFTESLAIYEEAIEATPNLGAAYLELVTAKRITQDDLPLVDRMKKVVAQGGLAPIDAIPLQYALGKALDNLGDYEAAMCHYDAANRLNLQSRPGSTPFDRKRFAEKVDRLISLFTADFIAENARLGSSSDLPIFVLGMMRSGTTLAEQILSCHPSVGAGGEQGHWTYWEHKIVDFGRKTIHPSALRRGVAAFCDLLREIEPLKQHVTDKNPANSMVAGLIAIAFPNARIIQMARNPVDTCLSIYMTPVRIPPDFACDRENIVFAYKHFARLMQHWVSVIRKEQLLVVQYEDLVQDRENVTRQMVEFCGLDWNETCLHPEENLGRVSTPSIWQVRQPINSGSVGRWKRYEPWLGAFAELSQ